ncbi:MAG: hypothetical protein ACK5QT_02555 [Oligoflexia bacterium]
MNLLRGLFKLGLNLLLALALLMPTPFATPVPFLGSAWADSGESGELDSTQHQGLQQQDLSEVRNRLKKCLVRYQILSPRTKRPVRSYVKSLCEDVRVEGEFVRSEDFEARVIPAKGQSGALCDLVIWGTHGALLLEVTRLPRGSSALDPLVTALGIERELEARNVTRELDF